MLVSLHVKNMALIREEEILFGEGLNILSGETGAGKSILIGSMNAALGAGNFKDYQTNNEEASLVELIFTAENSQAEEFLKENGIDCEDGQIILTRKYQNGRTMNRINGETVPLGLIREAASMLIDIHGQHQYQTLLKQQSYRELLDRYAVEELKDLPAVCAAKYRELAGLRSELEKAGMNESERAKQIDLIRYELEEIENAALQAGEDEILEAQFRRMDNSQKILETLSEISMLLSGSSGAADSISRCARLMSQVAGLDPQLNAFSEELDQIDSLLSDFGRELSTGLDEFAFDEETYHETEERLDLINRLKLKYGRTIEKILEELEKRRSEYERLQNYETWMEELRTKICAAEKELKSVCTKIHEIRVKNAAILEKKIAAALQDLNFPQVLFHIDVTQTDEIHSHGSDEINFLISVNPGMSIRPVREIASGGELSRIMLAIKSVMADQDAVGTLIFDEIDTGISGRTAQKVSEKIAVIARSHQVICITHLAQIAAMADEHFAIEKSVEEDRMYTHVRRLNQEEQEEELARILGGAVITETVRQSAAEMKKLAQQLKSEKGGTL